MAEKDKLGAIMTAFVAIILLVVFSTVIADNEVANTKLSGSVNESVTLVSGSGKVANPDTTGMTFFGNGTNNTITESTMLIGTTVNLSTNGTLQLSQTAALDFDGDGTYNVSYGYEGTLYVDDAPSRSLLNLTTLFWVLLGLGIGIVAFMATSDNMKFGFK